MPSGAKKRKAAKKKMVNQSNNNPPNPSHDGVNNNNNQDDDNRDGTSDVGEVSHHKGEEVGNVQIEGESIERDGKIEGDEPARKSYEGSSSSDSSSSSSEDDDDESPDLTTSTAVVDTAQVVESVKPADLVSETPAEPVSAAIIEEANVLVETPVIDEITASVEDIGEEAESCLEDKVEIAAASKTEEETVHQFVENTTVVSAVNECVVPQNDDALPPISVPVHNGAESERDSVTQPLLEQPVEKTSWKGCCGLCELFTGSSR